jgi:hypothetical protein
MIRNFIHNTTIIVMFKMYNTINRKLNNPEHIQTSTPVHLNNFYLRIINKTLIVFIAEELTLLNKGFKNIFALNV